MDLNPRVVQVRRRSRRLQGSAPPQEVIERRESSLADSRFASKPQNRPTVLPSASTSIAWAAGVLPSPGIVCMSPQSATIQPAPV